MKTEDFARIVVAIMKGKPDEQARAIYELLVYVRANGGRL